MVGGIKLHCRTVAVLLLALLVGCAANARGLSNHGLQGALPQLPSGLFDRHRTAQVQTSHLNGDDAVSYSPAASKVGNDIQLAAASGTPTVEWAIWQLAVSPGTVPQSATISLTLDAGADAWVGVADYSSGTWQLDGPVPDGDTAISPLAAGNVSPGNNLYVLVAAYSGTQLTVHSLDIDIDVPAPPTYFITGELRDTYQGLGFANQVVTLNPGNVQVTTVNSGNNVGTYTFVDLAPGNYTVSVPDISGYDCAVKTIPVDLTSSDAANVDFTYTPQSTDITYTNNIKLLLDAKCVQCHNEANPGGGYRYDTYIQGDSNDAFHNAEEAQFSVSNNNMPKYPVDPLNVTEKQLLSDWITVYNKAE